MDHSAGFVLAVLCTGLLLLYSNPLVKAAISSTSDTIDSSLLDLPANHLPYYLNAFPDAIAYICEREPQCMQQINAQLNLTTSTQTNTSLPTTPQSSPCWGYELGCLPANRFAPPAVCHSPNVPAAINTATMASARKSDIFFEQTDFGYIREQSRELIVLCEPRFAGDSSLECSPHLRFCRARGIRVDFRGLRGRTEPFRYRTDVLAGGQIAGRCRLHAERLLAETDHQSALQSWAAELQHFAELDVRIDELHGTPEQCDEIVERPTFFLKIDAAFNMYHHFCDFVNMYASLHVNGTHETAFSTDVQLLIWETYPYRSPFAAAWTAFSRHPVQTLNDVRGRVVCYRNLVLPLLPRMIFGLYYNTPIVKNCANSGLFQAFSEHVLHRLRVPFKPPAAGGKLRITVLSRLTKYRNIINVNELVGALARNESYAVQKVSFEKLPFTEQLAITRNTDIFIGKLSVLHVLEPDLIPFFSVYISNRHARRRSHAPPFPAALGQSLRAVQLQRRVVLSRFGPVAGRSLRDMGADGPIAE